MASSKNAKNKRRTNSKQSTTKKCEQTEFVSADTTIAEAVSQYPEIVPVLMQYGVHCIGCHVSAYETIEQGLAGHGFTKENIEKVVAELNAAISEAMKKKQSIKVKVKKGVKLTKIAAEKVKEAFSKQGESKKFLRIRVLKSGCCGFSYWLGLEESVQEYDVKLESGGIKLIIDPESYQFLDGTVIDYVQTQGEQGFKFKNPNEKSNC